MIDDVQLLVGNPRAPASIQPAAPVDLATLRVFYDGTWSLSVRNHTS